MSIHQILKGANTFERKNRAYQATFRHFFWRYAADGGSTDRYHEGLYNITRESDETRSDLRRRIKYYLGAKKIDGLSERTLKNYKANLESFAAKVEKSAAKITTDDIRGYIAYLDETRHLKETSLQTHINTLRAFFGWLTVEEKIKKNSYVLLTQWILKELI